MGYNKHDSTTAVSFSNMSGGINNAIQPELIAENECADILNMEYIASRIRTRGGVSSPIRTYTNNITRLYFDEVTNTYVVIDSANNVFYDDLNATQKNLGTLSGVTRPTFCKFDNKIFIASGEHLQYIDPQAEGETPGTTEIKLITIEASPLCSGVFQRFGRLAVYHIGDDNIYFSAVGDPYETGWEESTDDDSSSKWVEIGYKDDGDILRVVPVVNDLIIFKSNGSVYNLSGEILQETVRLMAENTDVKNQYSIDFISGAAMYMTDRGLMGIAPDVTYGNFQFNEIGAKFDNGIKGNVKDPHTYNLFRKMQLMICPNYTEHPEEFWCYQYDKQAATRIKFSSGVTDMVQTKDGVMLAIGKTLCRWEQRYLVDGASTAINSHIATRVVLGGDKAIAKYVDTLMAAPVSGNFCTITIEDEDRNLHTVKLTNIPTEGRKKTLINHSARALQIQVDATSAYELDHLAIGVAGFNCL